MKQNADSVKKITITDMLVCDSKTKQNKTKKKLFGDHIFSF